MTPTAHGVDGPRWSAAVVFFLVAAMGSPVMAVGYLLWIVTLVRSRASGVSGTAQGPLSARWLAHQLGTRPDPAAHRLLGALPGVSPLAVWLLFGPLLLAHRLSGYVPRSFRYPFTGAVTLGNQAAARQTFYDGVLARFRTTCPQVVILGAGFDTRLYRVPVAARRPAFEVDRPATLALKQTLLAQAAIATTGVTFVPTDFAQDAWFAQLLAAGCDPHQRTLFLWEGVTPYLDQAAVLATFQAIATMAPGSVVAFDYFTTEVLESPAVAMRLIRAALQQAGEPLRFGIDSRPPVRERLATLLASVGLQLEEHQALGAEGPRKRALGGFAIARVGDGLVPAA